MSNPISSANDLTTEQRIDLAQLLVGNLTPGNIKALAERVLGTAAILDVIGDMPDPHSLATVLVERMQEMGQLITAVAILKTEAARNSELIRGLNHIASGYRLATLPELQAVTRAPDDPFFNNDFLELFFPRVQRTVCAIGLASGWNCFRGTGFLIAPDLVMTNYHVVAPYLRVDSINGKETITASVSGDNICCYFDYLSPPRPLVPPAEDRPVPGGFVTAIKDGWLIKASQNLDKEGIPPFPRSANNRLDYAVIKLKRSIGNAPSRRAGGALRGWLPLNNQIDYLTDRGSRLVVLQHPAGVEQLFDVGVYDSLDPSRTRIWYAVDTEKGASGGPAVDKQGRVFALHNAAVKDQNGSNLKVNQGVRIDLILGDLTKDPPVTLQPMAEEDPGYWSISDNVSNPRPIIGRQGFRENIVKMMAAKNERVIVVTGPTGSGRRFSIELLRRVVGASVPIIRLSPNDLRTMTPKNFVKVLADELALLDAASIPEAKSTEPIARWIANDLPTWLSQKLVADQAKNPSRYPAWIIVDAVVPDGERLYWADNLPDLLSALMGPPDVTQGVAELPQLRWLLLGSAMNIFPPAQKMVIDDLAANENSRYAEDFANCIRLAWRSIESDSQIPINFLLRQGSTFVDEAKADQKPIRAYLAEYVRRFILAPQ